MIHLLHLLAAMLGLGIGMGQVSAAHWAHSTDLDNNYSVFWTPGEDHITFEVQVRTLGYIGFGFSVDGQMPGADIVVGWFQDNQAFLQDRHAPAGDQRIEPVLDASQDYELLLGYENGTHTVIRFRRRYDTCDSEDYRISNDTMRMLYAYHSEDPGSGGVMLYHGPVQRGARSIYLMERVNLEQPPSRELLSWELRNPAIILPASGDTLYWCKIFKLPNIRHKYHMVRYEPILQNGNRGYMHHVIVYECQGSDGDFEPHSSDKGQVCYQPNMPPLFYNCNNVVIAWAIGSEGFSFPAEAGYPLDPDSGTRYYMMETHYNNPNPTQDFEVTDSSGIRVYYTPTLRRHDAGVLSVGLDPNWRHIIPPGQTEVVSEGHCVSACTKQAIPPRGIDIFAVILHTHLIGRKVRFRQIRNGVELPPITADNNYDFNYQEYRRLQNPVKVYPGDHLIAECVYNSEGRATITLGGLSSHEEMCLVFGLYYPRIDLSLCHSLPSLPTVLHSLGIQELWPGSSPVRIKSPPDLADMTLENRLITYDWENNFKSFQDATHRGSFKPLCWMKKPTLLPGTEDTEEYYPNITKPYEEVSVCHSRWKKPRRRKKPGDAGDNSDSDVGAKGSEDEEEEDKTKVYSSVSLQETSRLNSGSYIFAKRVHVIVCVTSVMLFRR